MPTISLAPLTICPACGAEDPQKRYVDPPMRCPSTGYQQNGGYRCLECDEISETEDWDAIAAQICCECGKVGTANCVCPSELWLPIDEMTAGPIPPEFEYSPVTAIQKEVA